MKRSILVAVSIAGMVGCAAKPAGIAQDPSPEGRASRARVDSVRGEKLARALDARMPMVKPVLSTLKLGFDQTAAREGVAGSAIVAFVVMPNGRVDRDSRTLVFVEGHQIYSKHICDALLAARFEPAPTDPRGVVSVFPVFFSAPNGASRDSARALFREAGNVLGRRLATMTHVEAQAWFAARPNCSAIRIGLDPLYGPPPE